MDCLCACISIPSLARDLINLWSALASLKEKYTEKESTHKQRILEIEKKHKNKKLNDEFYTNETRDETRMFAGHSMVFFSKLLWRVTFRP